MASYKETFSAYYDALTEDVDRAKIADRIIQNYFTVCSVESK